MTVYLADEIYLHLNWLNSFDFHYGISVTFDFHYAVSVSLRRMLLRFRYVLAPSNKISNQQAPPSIIPA